jgi:BirA family biotin operon repressor/biotin-[acetyl-CoA-carboxylase] ligase
MKIIKLNAIDSTNNYLLGLLRGEQMEDFTVVFAEDQQNGRGQRGNRWVSKAQKSLTFSVFKRFYSLSMKHQFSVSMAVCIGIKKTLDKYGITDVSIKWPNDIMSRSKKLAGILIENQSKGSLVISTVIGVGINVNEDHFEGLPQATSMFLSSGKVFSREELLTNLIKSIKIELDRLNEEDLKIIHSEFEQHMFKREVISVFKEPQGKPFNGRILGVNEFGELRIECKDEIVRTFRMKEIEYLL